VTDEMTKEKAEELRAKFRAHAQDSEEHRKKLASMVAMQAGAMAESIRKDEAGVEEQLLDMVQSVCAEGHERDFSMGKMMHRLHLMAQDLAPEHWTRVPSRWQRFKAALSRLLGRLFGRGRA
jgi:hypothetical protein